MRCNNCGWDNPNTNTRCEKCNVPLISGVNNYVQESETPSGSYLNKTVNEAVAFPERQTSPGSSTCPICGYPLRPGSTECPQCKQTRVVQEESQQSTPRNETGGQAVIHQSPRVAKGTVNPWTQVNAQCKCSLTPIQQNTDTETHVAQVFKGETHVLNRSNLDSDNMTITSKEQAHLTFENGQWYIEDASQQKTTFIHVGAKTALKDGDIILMGNRQFIFKAE